MSDVPVKEIISAGIAGALMVIAYASVTKPAPPLPCPEVNKELIQELRETRKDTSTMLNSRLDSYDNTVEMFNKLSAEEKKSFTDLAKVNKLEKENEEQKRALEETKKSLEDAKRELKEKKDCKAVPAVSAIDPINPLPLFVVNKQPTIFPEFLPPDGTVGGFTINTGRDKPKPTAVTPIPKSAILLGTGLAIAAVAIKYKII